MSLLDGTAERKDAGKNAGGDLLGGLRVSLMPSSVEGPAAAPDLRKRLLVLALVLVVETLLVGMAYGSLVYMGSRRVTERVSLEQNIATEAQKTAATDAEARKAAVYNAQTVAAKAALDSRVRWSDFFGFLEERTKPTVKYVNFSGDMESGLVSLDALAASYRDAAEQIVIFREDPLVAEVRTSSAAANITPEGELLGVSFSLVLKLKKGVWSGGYTPSKSVTAVQSAAVSLACGSSTDNSDAAARCFAAKVRSCEPAAVTAVNTLGKGEYLIVGPGANGCRISFTYAKDISLTEFAGKSYECAYDASKDFWGQTGRTLDGCTGPLIDALTP